MMLEVRHIQNHLRVQFALSKSTSPRVELSEPFFSHNGERGMRVHTQTLYTHIWIKNSLKRKRIRGTRFLSPHLDINLEMSDSARQQQFKYILRAAAGAYFEACQWLSRNRNRGCSGGLSSRCGLLWMRSIYIRTTSSFYLTFAHTPTANIKI